MQMFSNLLDPVMNPLLNLSYLAAIIIVSFFITIIVTLVYKFSTDQEKMKSLKKDLNNFNKEIKKLQRKDPKKALDMQSKMMSKNMEYMKHSFKSTLYTLIPLIIIFSWLNANMAYMPLEPDKEFSVLAYFDDTAVGSVSLNSTPSLVFVNGQTQEINENKAVWRLKAEEGDYMLIIDYGDNIYDKEIRVSSEKGEYHPVIEKYNIGPLKQVNVPHDPVLPFGNIRLFGWTPGWLAAYIIFSLIFSTGLRKLMKVY